MNDIIGKLIYPESALDAEIYQSALYLTDNGNKLVFSIINRSSVAVTAFHADVIYFDKEEQKKNEMNARNDENMNSTNHSNSNEMTNNSNETMKKEEDMNDELNNKQLDDKTLEIMKKRCIIIVC